MPPPSHSSKNLTRREILAAFLGLPAALAACRSTSEPPLPAGEIVGASDAAGHRLRAPLSITPSGDEWQRAGVVIVGGGVAGLSAAWRLLGAGFEDFILLELEKSPGGTSRSGSSPLVSYPWGAHYLPVPMKDNTPLIALLREMSILEGRDENGEPIVAEQYLCRDPEERLFYKGVWYEGLYLRAGASAEDQAQLARFYSEVDAWVAWRDGRGRRAFTIPIAAASDDPVATELDKISMTEWLARRGYDSPRLRWLIDYSCRDDYGLTADQTSAWAGLFYFASRVSRPGEQAQPLMTWPEGNGRLVSHLYDRAKSKVRLGYAAARVEPTESGGKSGVDVVAIEYEGRSAMGIHADQVIFASPQFLSRHLISDYRESAPAHVADFDYGSWMVANLFLKERPRDRGFPLAWDNVLYESPSLGYVVATHQRGLDRGPTVFTYYYPLCDANPREARSRLLSADWAAWADVCLTDLKLAHPDIRELVERLDVCRWGHAMIRPTPGFIWGQSRRKAAEPFRAVHFAHSDLSGIALFEEAFYHGVRAAEEVLAARGQKIAPLT